MNDTMHPFPRVFVVDDQLAVRKALSRLLVSAGFEVASFGSAQEFLDGGHAAAPGCLVLDLTMPGMNGQELHQALVDAHSALPVIFLTAHGDISTVVQAMKSGAVDFLTKPVDGDRLIGAVQIALERNRLARLEQAEVAHIRSRLASLTPREREVLELVVAGQMNKQIASTLGTVEKTIKVHRARVITKMQAKSLAELVRLAARVGIP